MIGLQRLELEGKRFVVIEESEYERLCREAGEKPERDDLPEFPAPDKNGNFPAIEYTRISIARDLIRARRGVELSQQRLAELAGVRQETISRLESGKHTAAVGTIERLEKAIVAERQRRQKRKAK
ncbi:MAG: XRE family transcriptional regulator [Planctomycetaceae bacterium]|nr:XRE family transcriptional regulator [Planctomycetaceae bacterium]